MEVINQSPATVTPRVQKALLRAQEVAVMLGISVSGVFQMVARGLVPQPRTFGNRPRWYVADLHEMLNNLPVRKPKPKGAGKGENK